MSELLKLSEETSKLICDVLRVGIAKLELISLLPLKEEDFEVELKPVCHSVVDTTTFLPCRDIQSLLNKEKFSADCQRLIELLSMLHDELGSSQTYTKLADHVDKTVKELLELHLLLKNYQEQKVAVKKLEKLYANFKEQQKKEEAELLNESFQLAVAKEQQEFDLNVELNYISNYIKSQERQHELSLEKSEDEVNQKLFDISFKSFDTEDASLKICKFYRRRIKELQEENNLMSADYFVQLENYEMQIQIATKAKKELDQIIQKEHENFNQREKEMKDYQLKKQQKEEDKKLLSLHKAKIVVIQAWWRGLMVRLFLGRFRSYKKRARQIKKDFRLARAKKSKKSK